MNTTDAMISLDNGRSYTAVADLTEEQAQHAETCLPHNAALYAAAEGEGPMAAWLARYAIACQRTYGCWPVIG